MVAYPWQNEVNDYLFPLTKLPPRLVLPITMESTEKEAMNVLVYKEPSLNVYEGEEFPDQPLIRLLYLYSGNPVVGVSCVALLNGKSNDTFPRGFRTLLDGIIL
jgi:hypothetical protein